MFIFIILRRNTSDNCATFRYKKSLSLPLKKALQIPFSVAIDSQIYISLFKAFFPQLPKLTILECTNLMF